jgi:hypothetical protein
VRKLGLGFGKILGIGNFLWFSKISKADKFGGLGFGNRLMKELVTLVSLGEKV